MKRSLSMSLARLIARRLDDDPPSVGPSGSGIPADAILDRSGAAIIDRAGNYITTR